MKESDLLPSSVPLVAAAAAAAVKSETSSSSASSSLFGKGRYKFWALGAIILLAFWSMLTGTVTLKWSAGDLTAFPDDLDPPIHHDLDVLEVEEREKLVRHMWDVYTHNRRIQLPRFWQEAFEAAYEELASDDASVRDSAVSEIAKMSMRMVDLHPPPRSPKNGEMKKLKDRVGRANTKSLIMPSN